MNRDHKYQQAVADDNDGAAPKPGLTTLQCLLIAGVAIALIVWLAH